jgi:DNA-binding SARP family transcriptional activator
MTAASELPPLELVCFGPPTARLAGREPPPDVLWRKHLGVLIYLALSSDRTKSRDHLLGVFWPEKPEGQARHSLNEAVRRLRAGLGADRLRTHGDTITLNDTALQVDVMRFAALSGQRPAEAAALVRGDFLEGFTVEDAPAFEEWTAQERIRWRARGAAAHLAVAEAALAAGRLADALEAELQALALEPHSEPAARLRLRTLALRGDTAGALAWYHEFVERLSADLGERPGRDLEALAERIRTQSWRRVAVPPAAAVVPLVGDADLHRRAFGVIGEALCGAPRTLVIVGDQGLGKTRLVQECLARAALEGAVTVAATPLEQDHDAPWSTLRALARAGLIAAPGTAATDPEALAILAAVIPEISGRTPRAPVDRGEVAAALARLLAAAVEERPLVLGLDDAHFADGVTLEGLGAAMAAVAHGPLALVLSCLPDADRGPQALTRLRSEIGRRLPGDSVRLAPLSPQDVRRMVEAVAPWCTEDDKRERLTRRLMFETGGSAFLAVTLLQALARASTIREDILAWPRPGATIDSPLPISVPDLVRMAVVARISTLDAEDLPLVRAASVAGPGVDPDALERTSGLSAEAVERGLVRLERAGLIVSDGRRYAFAAPLIADVVSKECLTAGQRHSLRVRTAEALATRHEMDARVLRVELLSSLGPEESVFEDAVVIAEEAIGAGAVRSARRALAAAEHAAANTVAARERLAALRLRVEGAG